MRRSLKKGQKSLLCKITIFEIIVYANDRFDIYFVFLSTK